MAGKIKTSWTLALRLSPWKCLNFFIFYYSSHIYIAQKIKIGLVTLLAIAVYLGQLEGLGTKQSDRTERKRKIKRMGYDRFNLALHPFRGVQVRCDGILGTKSLIPSVWWRPWFAFQGFPRGNFSKMEKAKVSPPALAISNRFVFFIN